MESVITFDGFSFTAGVVSSVFLYGSVFIFDIILSLCSALIKRFIWPGKLQLSDQEAM